ncbi:zinc dependent phospholipase C family protein [Thomasclavelia sp.]|uniref:zinc dependent phospholipase C family protein n=1 Tax=Thomasclavelia sp. TaxID=3025757 RepID=UPI0025D3CFD9|nr:zinc dependent phospholipase C family protein [Thomasclavelia sp.]
MPASYSHYRLGNIVLNQLDGPLKQILIDYLDFYNIGLHGPDILFYNRPYLHSRVNRLGSSMHKEIAREFFEPALKKLKQTQSKAQLAYLCGFVCHFILDSNCHSQVDLIMANTKRTHFEIETELDRYFMIKDGLDPLRTHLTNHVHINDDIVTNIEIYFNRASKKDIYKSLTGFKFYDRLLVAPQIYKRALIYLVLKITFTFKRFQGFVVNYKQNKTIEPYLTILENLFNQSIEESIKAINEFVLALKNDLPLSSRFDQNFK